MLAAGVALGTLAGALAAPPARAQDGAGVAKRLQEALAAIRRKTGSPGASLAVIAPSGSWALASGLASVEDRRALVPEDRLRAASVTKLFTSSVVLQLVAERRLALDDAAAPHLPPEVAALFTDSLAGVTVRRLLDHTSGLPDFHKSRPKQQRVQDEPARRWTADELLACAAPLPHAGAPGEVLYYSNTNYLLLERLVEHLEGRTLAASVAARITGPLGLASLAFEHEPDPPGRARRPRVPGYEVTKKGTVRTDEIDDGLGHGDAGLVGTASDFAAFARALFTGRVVGATELPLMLFSHPDPDGAHGGGAKGVKGDKKARAPLVDPTAEERYGLGVMIRPTPWGAALGHAGRGLAFTSDVVCLPERGVAVAVLANDADGGGTCWSVALAALRIVLDD